MTVTPDAALAYAQKNRKRFVDELKDFVSIPSVSTDTAANRTRACALHEMVRTPSDELIDAAEDSLE